MSFCVIAFIPTVIFFFFGSLDCKEKLLNKYILFLYTFT